MNDIAPEYPISFPREAIIAFCKRWKIQELSFFGSVVRNDFGPTSDIDILVKFFPGHGWSLFEHVEAQDELSAVLGRRVDLVSKSAIERSHNEIRRGLILGEAKVYFADEEAA